MKTILKINPEDFLLIHKIAVALNVVKPYDPSTLETINNRRPGWLYIYEQYGKDTFSWDSTTFKGNWGSDYTDLTDVAIPVIHTMILDDEEVRVSEKAYNQIKEFISCE